MKFALANSTVQNLDPRISYALKVSKIGLWEYDLATHTSTWSNELFEIYGIAPQEEPVDFDFFITNCIHPDDAELFRQALDGLATCTYDSTFRAVLPNGEIRIVHSQALTDVGIRDGKVMGVSRDVTSEKEIERELRASNESYESANYYNGDGTCCLDLNGFITKVNPSLQKITGYTSSELLGMHYSNLYLDWDHELPKHHQPEFNERIEIMVRHKDGHAVHVRLKTLPMIVQGKTVGVYAVVRDVTELKQSEAELKQSRENLERAEQFARLGHWHCDISSDLIYWSNETYRIFGLPTGMPVTDETYFGRIHPEDLTRVQQAMRDSLQGVPRSLEYRIVGPSGEVRYVYGKSEALYQDGQVVRIFGVVQDITERKSAEQQLQKYQEMFSQSDKLSVVGQLAAGIAHEIRNPLTTLKGFTQIFRDKARGQNKRYFEIMQNELESIQQILDELLMVAKPQAVKFTVVEIDLLIQEVIALMGPQAAMQNIRIDRDFMPDIPSISGEPNQLKQVFINIIKNAFEAMDSGGRLLVHVRHNGGTVQIQFTDSGCGIPKDLLERLGEPFYTTKANGTGLGLLVTRRIIDTHRGTLTFSSQVGCGTTVEVRLSASQSAM